jgi:4-hydroxy-tetrahydrodipicolinate reductase
MGRALVTAIASEPDLTNAAGLDRDDAIAGTIDDCDVVIDFSSPAATGEVCRVCAEGGKPLVLGTTGHSASEKEAIALAARIVPIVFAANFSVGVNVLFVLVRQAIQSLGEQFDLEVIETHHRTKKDAPSGTAKRLLEILKKVPGNQRPLTAHSIRAGDIVGDHTVLFAGKGERLELTHRAGSRETFAVGALRAARWVVEQPPGLYDMEDVLAL